MVLRRRLFVKSKPCCDLVDAQSASATAAAGASKRKHRRSVRKKKLSTKKRMTKLHVAKVESLVPKARPAYAIFSADKFPALRSCKKVIAAWRCLDDDTKNEYKAKAAAERADQSAKAATAIGWFSRTARPQPGLLRKDSSTITVPGHMRLEPSFQIGPYVAAAGEEVRLGEGSYGTVFKGKHIELGSFAAVKVVKGSDALERLRREAQVYADIGRTVVAEQELFLVCLASCFEGPMAYLALSYVPAGSVAKQIRSSGAFPEEEVAGIAGQLAMALLYLHSLKWLHLDVKPGNMLYCPHMRKLQLADFGAAEHFHAEIEQALPIVTPNYRAPELWRVLEHRPTTFSLREILVPPIDGWAYGVSVYELLRGQLLFPHVSGSHIQAWCDHWEGRKPAELLRSKMLAIPRHWRSFLWNHLAPDPKHRPFFQDLESVRGVFRKLVGKEQVSLPSGRCWMSKARGSQKL